MQTGFTEMRSRYTGAVRLRARPVVAGTSPRLICTVATGLVCLSKSIAKPSYPTHAQVVALKGVLRVPQREGLKKFREKRRRNMRFGGQYRPKYRRGLAHVELRRTPRAVGMPQMKTPN